MTLFDSNPSICRMPHLIEDILKNMTYQQIFEKRQVDSTWHSICTKLVNKGCFDMKRKFEECFQYLDQIHSECKFYDGNRYNTFFFQHLLDLTRSYLELIQFEFNLTLACVGRYFKNHEHICLFDCRLLDHTACLISRVYKFPWHDENRMLTIFDPALDRHHADQYRYLSKQCQLKFNYHVERPINVDKNVSGAKLVDILDALLERPSYPVKNIHWQEYSVDTKLIQYKATYTLYNAWFRRERIAEVEDTSSTSFNSFHYFLYIRLIRLARYHNRFTLEAIHKERMSRCEFWDDERAPSGITFSGKGDNDGYSYKYACLNDKMKHIKFRHESSIPEIRLDLVVTLTSSYVSGSMNLQEYLRSNYRDLDYETRRLQMKLEVFNHHTSSNDTPNDWSFQIP